MEARTMQVRLWQLVALTTLVSIVVAVVVRLSTGEMTVRVDDLSEAGAIEGVKWTLTVDVPPHEQLDSTPHWTYLLSENQYEALRDRLRSGDEITFEIQRWGLGLMQPESPMAGLNRKLEHLAAESIPSQSK
jgi:hypothetical protein